MSSACRLHVICTSSAHRADDKRQQLCIKPTGFLVFTLARNEWTLGSGEKLVLVLFSLKIISEIYAI